MAQPTPSAYVDLTLQQGIAQGSPEDTDALLYEVAQRVASVESEHAIFRTACQRFDALYYPKVFTAGGADIWPEDKSATTDGRSHVSLNSFEVYVGIPASLQSVRPIENMLATEDSDEGRHAANAMERVYKAWKTEEKFELKFHKAATIKGLYGRTAGYVYYDQDKKRPCVDIVDQPRNLYMGYKSDTYDEVEWAAYVTRREPNAVVEEFGVDIASKQVNHQTMPWILPTTAAIAEMPYSPMNFGPARIEVWDYWYRRPSTNKRVRGKPVKMDTWNLVVAGNQIVSGPTKYKEYKGVIPYVPLFNTFIPGMPTGRGELHDVEHLIREKMERITSGSQMIAGATAGDFWQITGENAPARGAATGFKPTRNTVVSPGAGNRIEAIAPYVAEFQLEQFLGRLDRELAIISGLNDLLLGLAPVQSLSSSRAVNALIANYEARLSMRRMLFYTWRRDMWDLVVQVFAEYNKDVAAIVAAGGGVLDIIDPSLSPRDESDTAVRAANLVNAKLWSQARGMDAVGVEDPEQEQNIIREERTDATLFPESVQIMAQLMAALQSLGLQAPADVQAQGQAQVANGQNDLRNALGAATPTNTTSSQDVGDQGATPPIPGAAPEAGGAPAPFAKGPAAAAGAGPAGTVQTLIRNGKGLSQIKTQQQLGRR